MISEDMMAMVILLVCIAIVLGINCREVIRLHRLNKELDEIIKSDGGADGDNIL